MHERGESLFGDMRHPHFLNHIVIGGRAAPEPPASNLFFKAYFEEV